VGTAKHNAEVNMRDGRRQFGQGDIHQLECVDKEQCLAVQGQYHPLKEWWRPHQKMVNYTTSGFDQA
jgi:hypothetical protein